MPTILCIEDEADLRADIAEELKEAGFSVIEAEDGREGLEKILAHSPDLVTCDINMPRLNGKELLRELRENHPQFAQMPFLFLTAYATRAHMLEGIQLGVDDYITKPVDFDLLIAKIHQRLAQVKNIVARKNRELLTLYNKYLDMQSSAMAQQSKTMPTNLRDIPIVVIGKLEREIKAFVSVASEVFTNITLFPDVDTYLAKRQGFRSISPSSPAGSAAPAPGSRNRSTFARRTTSSSVSRPPSTTPVVADAKTSTRIRRCRCRPTPMPCKEAWRPGSRAGSSAMRPDRRRGVARPGR